MINEIRPLSPNGVEPSLEPRDLTLVVKALRAKLEEETKECRPLEETYPVGIVYEDARGIPPSSEPSASRSRGNHGSEARKGIGRPFEER